MTWISVRGVALIAIATVLAAACGGGSGGDDDLEDRREAYLEACTAQGELLDADLVGQACACSFDEVLAEAGVTVDEFDAWFEALNEDPDAELPGGITLEATLADCFRQVSPDGLPPEVIDDLAATLEELRPSFVESCAAGEASQTLGPAGAAQYCECFFDELVAAGVTVDEFTAWSNELLENPDADPPGDIDAQQIIDDCVAAALSEQDPGTTP